MKSNIFLNSLLSRQLFTRNCNSSIFSLNSFSLASFSCFDRKIWYSLRMTSGVISPNSSSFSNVTVGQSKLLSMAYTDLQYGIKSSSIQSTKATAKSMKLLVSIIICEAYSIALGIFFSKTSPKSIFYVSVIDPFFPYKGDFLIYAGL